jgi:2-keto-4-pentenoate hydratase
MSAPTDNNDQRLQRAADFLLALRRPGSRPLSLPAQLAPHNESEAYHVQQVIAIAQGDAGGYWKVAMSDTQTGTCAPVFAADVHSSGAHVASPIADELGIEPEVAFTLRSALPPLKGGQRYERNSVMAAIGSAHAAIEIVVSRFLRHELAEPLDRLADNISNAGLVLGPPYQGWRQLNFAALPLRLTVTTDAGDPQEYRPRGGHPQGDPLLPMIWLANHRVALGSGLKAGDVVTTGSYAGLRRVGRGTHVRVEFEGLGAVELYG